MATGKELRNAIKGKGLTFEAAAAVLGISRQTLHTYMSKAKIENDILKNVKEKLDILLSETEEESQNQTSDIISQLAKAILHHAETINSQQYVIRHYIEKEPKKGPPQPSTTVIRKTTNGTPNKK